MARRRHRLARFQTATCEASYAACRICLCSHFCGGGVDHRTHARYAIRRESTLLRMCAHGRFIWRDVDTVNLVVGDEALQPLNLRPHALQHAAGLLRDSLQFVLRQLTGPSEFAFNHKFGHCPLLSLMRARNAPSDTVRSRVSPVLRRKSRTWAYFKLPTGTTVPRQRAAARLPSPASRARTMAS